MRLGLTVFVFASLVSILSTTAQQIASRAAYEEILEKGREHRREQTSGAASNGGPIGGWRRKRNVKGKIFSWGKKINRQQRITYKNCNIITPSKIVKRIVKVNSQTQKKFTIFELSK